MSTNAPSAAGSTSRHHHASPPRAAIDELIADLRDDLKTAGMTWLCALAAYPEIHWGITLRLGVALVPGEVEALLPRLARLVWLREARMPEWLRSELLDVRVDPASGEVHSLGLALLREGSDNPLPGTALLQPLRARLGLDELRQPYALVGWHGDQGAWAAPRTLDDGAQAGLPGAGALSADGNVAALALVKGATAVVRDGENITVRSFRQAGGPSLSNDGQTLALLQPGAAYSVIRTDIGDVSVDRLASEGISALAVAADGSRIARGGSGGQVSIANAPRYSEFAELATPLGQKITAIAFSSDGARVAAGDASGQMAVWEVVTGKRVGGGWSASGHPVDSLALSADGARVAYADGLAALYAIAHGGGRWVAVGDRGTALGSADGLGWEHLTTGSPGSRDDLRLVVHDGQRWLAVGAAGAILTSDDGHAWQLAPGLALQVAGFSADGDRLALFERSGGVWLRAVPKTPDVAAPTAQTDRPPKAAKPPATLPKPAPSGQPVGKQPASAQQPPVGPSESPLAENKTPASGASEVPQTPGELFRDCDQCPEMVVVPAGKFLMGSPDTEEGRTPYEGPQHWVTFARPFAVGKYELTFGEWDACVAAGGCQHKPGGQGWRRGRRPVINVSWDDAPAYVSWLAKRTGKPYRLLSEAEWEYAARAGTRTRYPWGDEPETNRANFDGSGSQWGGKSTAPVGSFTPNTFGLYDMIGNVWE